MTLTRLRIRTFTAGAACLGAALFLAGTATDASALGRFGLGAMYRNDVDFGVQVRFDAPKGDNLSFVPQAGYFFDNEFLDLNFDIHYTANQKTDSKVYLLGGANLATDFDDSEFGLNVGGGVSKDLTTSLTGFAEVKYVISDLDGIAIQAGLHF